MSFYFFTTTDGVNLRHDDDPYAVSVFDDSLQPIAPTFSPASDDYDCGLSVSADRFALGHWNSANLKLFHLRSGEPIRTFPIRKIASIATFDRAGKRLLLKSGSSVLLLKVESGEQTVIKGVRALECLVVIDDEAIVPSQKKGELLRISLTNGKVTNILLPFDSTLFDLKPSPDTQHLIAIDRKKCIHCIDRLAWSVLWSQSFKKMLHKDHMAVGQFSGDGRLFGAAVSASNHNYTIVMDAATGEYVSRHETLCYGLPHTADTVRAQSTVRNSYEAKTLDLFTGKVGTFTLKRDG